MTTLMPMPFGNPSTYKGHSGVDFGQAEGAIIRASGDGIVTFSGWWNDRAGYSTIVKYEECTVLYCHQPKDGNRPHIATEVNEGTIIGLVGSSGRSTGPHLHMEIMNGRDANTYKGIWNYFDPNKVVGSGSTAGNKVEYEDDEMPYIAVVGKGGNSKFYLVQNVKGQPTGHLLGAESGARESGLPIINYPYPWEVEQLKKTTVLLG